MDIVIFEDTLGHAKKLQALREQAQKAVYGPLYSDRPEVDRPSGLRASRAQAG